VLGAERPEEANVANTIRAELIRFLALGGDAENPVHDEGVMLWGGWIKGVLSLHQAQAAVRLSLKRCHFDTAPVFNMSRLTDLVLDGSAIPGLRADSISVSGSVFLSDGFCATGEVRLLGAQIGGDLACSSGRFANAGGNAIQADRIRVTGCVFFDDGFSATGEVHLLGAQIGGDLVCRTGSFANTGKHALSAETIAVVGSLLLDYASIDGAILLSGAQVGSLVDDKDCWKAGGHFLDGFHYDRIILRTDAAMRVGWLKQQHPDYLMTDFRPQPWEQLIKVLREMGHPDEAAKVAIAKQDQIRIANAAAKRNWNEPLERALHWVYGKGVGYGHRPIWTVYWMMAVCMVFALAFFAGREWGYFGPTSPLIHASAAFDACGAPGEAGKVYWTSTACPTPPEYTTFQPFLYSLDLILPLVDLHQEADWGPMVVNPKGETLWPGRILRWMMWFEILFGWVASLTLVAVLGRLVDKD
jgi:hypothetical protein